MSVFSTASSAVVVAAMHDNLLFQKQAMQTLTHPGPSDPLTCAALLAYVAPASWTTERNRRPKGRHCGEQLPCCSSNYPAIAQRNEKTAGILTTMLAVVAIHGSAKGNKIIPTLLCDMRTSAVVRCPSQHNDRLSDYSSQTNQCLPQPPILPD